MADTANGGDFGTAGERRFVRSVEVSAENQGLEIGGVGQVLSKSASTRWKRRTYKGANPHRSHFHISFTTLGDKDGSYFNLEGEANDAFFQSFSGDGTTTTFTLSEDLGTEEKGLMVLNHRHRVP